MTFASGSVIAKARAVMGRSVTAEDYAQLALSESVSDVCAYLKQTPRFEKALANTDPQTIHRGQLENLLRHSLYDTFDSFRKFDVTESADFFHFVIERLCAEQVILAVECVAYGGSDEFIALLPPFLLQSSDVDLAALGTAKTLADAAEILRPTHYFKAVGAMMLNAADNADFNIGEFERRIKTHYYMRLLKMADKALKGSERKDFRRLILRSVDMANVVTLYRYSVVFGSEPENIPLIDFRYRLSDEVVERLAHELSAERIAEALSEIGYSAEGDVPPTIELLTERISLDFLKKTLHLSQSPAVAYFALSECLSIELANIKTIIEGIRYGMNSSKILELLVV